MDTAARLNERSGLVDQVLVIDADSADGTADIARAHGAEVYSENELLPEFGPALGKGDAMWRGLPPSAPNVWELRRPETYLHAVATEDGLRLDEHLNELFERPPMAQVLQPALDEELPAYQVGM